MLVFFLFCGKWLFAMKLVFLHFEFVFCVYFPCFLSFVPYFGSSFPCVGTFVPSSGTFPARVFAPYDMYVPCPSWCGWSFLFSSFRLFWVYGIRLIPLFLSWNAKILRFSIKKSSKSLAVALKVATFASAFGREPFAIVLWEFYMRQER